MNEKFLCLHIGDKEIQLLFQLTDPDPAGGWGGNEDVMAD